MQSPIVHDKKTTTINTEGLMDVLEFSLTVPVSLLIVFFIL